MRKKVNFHNNKTKDLYKKAQVGSIISQYTEKIEEPKKPETLIDNVVINRKGRNVFYIVIIISIIVAIVLLIVISFSLYNYFTNIDDIKNNPSIENLVSNISQDNNSNQDVVSNGTNLVVNTSNTIKRPSGGGGSGGGGGSSGSTNNDGNSNPPICIPDCIGKQCGDDSCGGSCGVCIINNCGLVNCSNNPYKCGMVDDGCGGYIDCSINCDSIPKYYVAVNGSAIGDGTINNPWDFSSVLSGAKNITPGSIIYLLNGTYIGRFTSELVGEQNKPIILKANPGSRVIIDGNGNLPNITLLYDILPALNYSSQLIYVTNTTLLINGNVFRIDDEEMQVANIINQSAVWVNRGWSGTDAGVNHSSGTLIEIDQGSILNLKGDYVWLWNIEIMSSDPVRYTTETGSSPWDIKRGELDFVSSTSVKLINLIIHDTRQGISSWSSTTDFEAYGNVVYNNGWYSTDRGHGHGIYTQNRDGMKLYKDNVILHNFGIGVQQYGSDQAYLKNFLWERNVFFNDRMLFGGGAAMNNITIRKSMFYTPIDLGYSNPYNENIYVYNNYLGAAPSFKLSKNVYVFNNTFAKGVGLRLDALPTNIKSDYKFNTNTYHKYSYYHPWHQFSVVMNDPSYCATFFWWNETSQGFGYGNCLNNTWTTNLRYDLDGTYIEQNANNSIFVYPNEYDKGRGNIVVYNWDNLTYVSVNISDIGFNLGESYYLHNSVDYYGDIVTGVYDGNNITINMDPLVHTIAKPVGYDYVLENTTFPKFGSFIIDRF